MQGHEKKLDEMKQLDKPVNEEKEERDSRKKIMSGIMNDEKFTTPTWTYRKNWIFYNRFFCSITVLRFWCEKLKTIFKIHFQKWNF